MKNSQGMACIAMNNRKHMYSKQPLHPENASIQCTSNHKIMIAQPGADVQENHFKPNPSLFTTASQSSCLNFSRLAYRYSPSVLKQVRAIGYREQSSPMQASLILRLVAPIAGIRSLPVINDRTFRWASGGAFSKNSQNHCTTGRYSGRCDCQLS